MDARQVDVQLVALIALLDVCVHHAAQDIDIESRLSQLIKHVLFKTVAQSLCFVYGYAYSIAKLLSTVNNKVLICYSRILITYKENLSIKQKGPLNFNGPFCFQVNLRKKKTF